MNKKGASDSYELTERPQANNSPSYEPTYASLQSVVKPEKKSKVLCYSSTGIATTIAILALILALIALILVVIAFKDIPKQQTQPQSQTDTGSQDVQALQSQLNSYGQQIESLQSQLNNYNQLIQAQITNFNQALQSQLTNHNQQIQDLQSQQSASDQEIGTLQTNHNQQIQELNEALHALQSQQTSYHLENQAIQLQIQQISEFIDYTC